MKTIILLLLLSNSVFSASLETKQSIMISKLSFQQQSRTVKAVMSNKMIPNKYLDVFYRDIIVYTEDLFRFVNGLNEAQDVIEMIKFNEMEIILRKMETKQFMSHPDNSIIVRRLKSML